jgi:SAUR family protein
MTMLGLLRRVSTGACRVAPGAVAEPGPPSPKVPAGHVPVEVGAEGEQTERFLVPAELLGRPPIAELLRRAAQEYGYARSGPLRIPCPAAASSARSPPAKRPDSRAPTSQSSSSPSRLWWQILLAT